MTTKRNIVEACLLARSLRSRFGNDDRWAHVRWEDGEVSPYVGWLANYIRSTKSLAVEVIVVANNKPSMAILARYDNVVRVYLNRDPRLGPDSRQNPVLGAFGSIKEFFHVVADTEQQFVAPKNIASLVEALVDADGAWSRLPTSFSQGMDSETFAIACAMEFVFPWHLRKSYLSNPALKALGRNRLASALKVPEFVVRKLLDEEYGTVSAQVNGVLDTVDSTKFK
jgi:hypothetical protein